MTHIPLRGKGWTSSVTVPPHAYLMKDFSSYGFTEVNKPLLLAWLHHQRRADILISADPLVHKISAKMGYMHLHVVSPQAGLKLFGLLLRYHEQYTIRSAPNYIIGRWPFYLSLARTQLRAFWRYLGAAGKNPGIASSTLSQSILQRAARALAGC
jgi:hypothetical protein